ncbi:MULTISPECIES: hypothetical protein [Halomonadaceae]|nr:MULTISPECIES: hypothetical protein [Halomonas]MCC4288175.1 hypothetical protein [Halomonas meridiana]MCO7243566.1 hypothetical protein [Halomonas sp. Ps84H-12]MCP1303635.1 hypothetical protein [Halomonas sp. R1t8]MCP1329608.1 hypothetical protein [Halomonas sp. R1t4]
MNVRSQEPITQQAPGGGMAERAPCPVCGCEDSPDYQRRVTDWFHAHWLSCQRCGYQTATHPAFESAERDWDKAATGRQAEEAGLLVPAVQVFSMRDLELLESLQMQVPEGDCARTYLVSRDALERWKEVARLGREEVDETLAPAVASVEHEIAALLHAQQDED